MEAYKEVVNWVVGVLTIGGIAVVKHTTGTRAKVDRNKVYNAETFVTKKTHERSEDRVLVVLDRIENSLMSHIRDTAK